MHSDTAQSGSIQRVVSRRGVVRGAAWSTAAVTIVVATPNIAAASHGEPHLELTTTSIQRSSGDANVHYVTWSFTLTNTGTVPLHGLTATVSEVTGVTALSVRTGGVSWTGSGVSSRTYGTLEVGASIDVVVVFTRGNNSKGTATVNLVAGTPSVSVGVLSTPFN